MYTETAHRTEKDVYRLRETRETYQKAHHPEKHRNRSSKEMACEINFSACMGIARTTSGLNIKVST